MDSIVAYLVAAMIGWVPLHAHAPSESIDDARDRYESIARDVVSVAFDESESPLFSGPEGRTQTALLMLSVASYESSYRKKVDDGRRWGIMATRSASCRFASAPASRAKAGAGTICVTDRRLCFRAGLHILRGSFGACRALAVDDRLSAYATGHCFADAAISRSRVGRARAWREAHVPPRRRPRTAERRRRAALPLSVENCHAGAHPARAKRERSAGEHDKVAPPPEMAARYRTGCPRRSPRHPGEALFAAEAGRVGRTRPRPPHRWAH